MTTGTHLILRPKGKSRHKTRLALKDDEMTVASQVIF